MVSKSRAGLAKVDDYLRGNAAACGLIVSEKKTKLGKPQQQPPPPPAPTLIVKAAGQQYKQTDQLIHLGGVVNEEVGLTREVKRRSEIGWGCSKEFSCGLFLKSDC